MPKKNHPTTGLAGKLQVAPGGKFRLKDLSPRDTPGTKSREEAEARAEAMALEMSELQEVLYAEGKQSLLLVLQAMDTGGKDGTIRHVLGPLNPQGVQVHSFKAPSAEELSHDFLWRIHERVPRKGMIGVFNRSHYEDVLIVRVHKLAPKKDVDRRYEQINAFEKYLSENGVRILKICLHISKEEQKQRLEARLARPDKHWKFDPGDLAERKLWDDYQDAYEKALTRCSTPWAPWHVVPADRKWYRNFAVASLVLETLKDMKPAYPAPPPGLDRIVIE